jgi:RNA polymerase sigma-70 factor, ECF subfamily
MVVRDPFAKPGPLIGQVYAYAAYRLGDGPDAEDVTSETFARALRYRESYDADRGEPIAWLIGIARRCIENAAARPVCASEHPDVADSCDVEREATERVTLHAAVRKLHARDQELIALRYGADLSARQIAELLGIRTNTAEVALHRALSRLRTTLEEDDFGESSRAVLSPVRV